MKTTLAVTFAAAATLCGLAPGRALAESAGGISFTAPAGWTAEPARQMRVATYQIPHAKKDAENAELAVYYFGEGQGGTIDANVQRWASQFDGDPTPNPKKQKVNGVEVTRVDLSGTYEASMGPMGPMAQKTPHPGYRLLGAIVDVGHGPVFWKLTGPAATVDAARAGFDKLVRSIKKD